MQNKRNSHVIGVQEVKRVEMLSNSYNIRTSIFAEKWLAWLSYHVLKSGAKGRMFMSILASAGIRLETEYDYLLLPSKFEASTIANANMSLSQTKKSILSNSGQEILRNLSRLNNCDQG
jgi:hypothetical protein